jgi:cysteine-rich repeat protein
VTYNANNDNYKEVNGFKCAKSLTCTDIDDTGANDVEFQGVCKSEKCNGKGPNGKDEDNGTHKVTICHRTCSETNPWVRITIDDDAWKGNMCGHESEHDVLIDCKNKDPSFWGENHKDYLIKDHGTRQDVRNSKKFARNSADEKAYWKYWERACPYVRNGHCCSWDDGDCCGDEPNEPTQNLAPGPVCGNGKMEEGETCDDGNTIDGDGCDSNCQIEPNGPGPVCGNGKMEEGETCDDGNTIDGDGCDSNCQIETNAPPITPTTPDGGPDDDGEDVSIIGSGTTLVIGSYLCIDPALDF